MNAINALKLPFLKRRVMIAPSAPTDHGAATAEIAVEPVEADREPAQLQLHSALLDRVYIHQLAAEAVISNRSCRDPEQTLEHLAQLSLDRLKADYETRKQFIELGTIRAKVDFEDAVKKCAVSDPPALAPASRSPASVTESDSLDVVAAPSPHRPISTRGEEVSSDSSGVQAPTRISATPTAREKELEQELISAQDERATYTERLADLEKLGNSHTRSAAMRLFGIISLTASTVALAILFDSFTRDFPLFRDLIAGMRATFLPGTNHSQGSLMLGFIEILLLCAIPLLPLYLFRTVRFRNAVKKTRSAAPALRIAAFGVYATVIIVTFSGAEAASRLLLDFALAFGVAAVSASLVFYAVTRLRPEDEGAKPWWARSERMLIPFAFLIPLALVALALTTGMGPWIKLIPGALLACLLMIGSLSLAYGLLFRDIKLEIEERGARIAGLRAEIENERQLALKRADAANAIPPADSHPLPIRFATATLGKIVSDVAVGITPQIAGALESHSPNQYAAAIKDVLKSVAESASPAKTVERAEISLRAYESSLTRLENRYSELRVEHAIGWAKATIDLRAAYALCRMGATMRPRAATFEPELLIAAQ